MGYFRRYKLSDYTADKCRKQMRRCVHRILWSTDRDNHNSVEQLMDEWACFRELLACHEKKNESPLDKE